MVARILCAPPLPAGSDSLKQKQIFIRPNPVSDELHLFLPEGYPDAIVEITIFRVD
jgi:hypothetical protein